MLTRVEPIEKDIDLLIRQDLSPSARSKVLADFARATLEEAQRVDEAALGRVPPHETIVDGSSGVSEDEVRPEGVIAYVFELATEMFAWIDEQLKLHSPVGGSGDKHPGLYKQAHIFYADDVAADPLHPPVDVQVGTFVNAVPYARKIEAGESPQQPEGVYEAVAALASRRFGNIARIHFDYRAVAVGSVLHGLSGNKSAGRNPAIVVTLR